MQYTKPLHAHLAAIDYIVKKCSGFRGDVSNVAFRYILLCCPEWQLDAVTLLHPSCGLTLKTMKFMLQKKEEVTTSCVYICTRQLDRKSATT